MANRDFTPAKHSSLRQAVSQMESLKLSTTPPESAVSSNSSRSISQSSSPANEPRGRSITTEEEDGIVGAMKIEMPQPTPFYGATGPA